MKIHKEKALRKIRILKILANGSKIRKEKDRLKLILTELELLENHINQRM